MNSRILLGVIATLLLIIAFFVLQNHPPASACGNSVCDTGEEKTCPDDCLPANGTKPDGGQTYCGNGECDDHERAQGICPQDCGTAGTPPITPPIPRGNLSEYEDSPFGISAEYYGFENSRIIDSRFTTPPGATKDYLIDLGVKWVMETYVFLDVFTSSDGSLTIPRSFDDMAIGLDASGIQTMNVFSEYMPWDQAACHPSGACSLPCDEAAYLGFVNKIVERYDGDEDYGCTVPAPGCYKAGDNQYPSAETRQAITNNPWKYWSVGNEPDMGCPGKGGCFFTPCETGKGMDEYFHLMEITYPAIKEACPDCKVPNGALAGILGSIPLKGNAPVPEEMLLSTWLQRIDSQELDYFDVMNFHDYDSINRPHFDERLGTFAERYGDSKEMIITEMGAFSNVAPFDAPIENYDYSERTQAEEILKRYVIPLSYGVDVIAYFSLAESAADDCSLIPPGKVCEAGFEWGLLKPNGTKKLSYYSYKLMVEKLEGSDWDDVQEVYAQNNVYAYKFLKQGQPIWVVWWDYWNEPTQTTKAVTLQTGAGQFKITEAVPQYETGQQVTSYTTAFNTGGVTANSGQMTIALGQSPVYIEETTEQLAAYAPHQWQSTPTTACGDGWCDKTTEKDTCPQDCHL